MTAIVAPGALPKLPTSTTLSTLSNSVSALQTQQDQLHAAQLGLASIPTGDMTDTTTGEHSSFFLTAYTGPVAGLNWEFIDTSVDNLNITATTPNVFLHSGSGEDALQVTSGNNVLDGGTGSNFLVGGTGNDTFFVDDRNATADIWSTMVHFHAGDSATLWGVSQKDFSLNWADNRGAAGFTGLTLTATAAGKSNVSMTLTGFSQADLTNGRLAISFGTDAASGSTFMNIHGN
jgi:Ca2+-binding RTX toxin-like protein